MYMLEIIDYEDLQKNQSTWLASTIKDTLSQHGIIGIRNVPNFLTLSKKFIASARQFSSLSSEIKNKYSPMRDLGDTEGYELGAEWFKDQDGNWQIDNKKASYYAFVPDHEKNKWPEEVDLKSIYLQLGELIFTVGKQLLHTIGIDAQIGISHQDLIGYGRMLHYQQETDPHDTNPNWCGAHFDHGILTGLIPAYYFKEAKEIEEPENVGLYIQPTHQSTYLKIDANDKSILLFQVGEFAQLAIHDQIRATKHLVKKASAQIERYTFALFFSAGKHVVIQSHSQLMQDSRYQNQMTANKSISYGDWEKASFELYRAK